MVFAQKKAEMGMGTLIIFIAMILVAAMAASVLISTTGTLQNKALSTGKATTQEVGTSIIAIEVFAEDGSDQLVDYWYETVKLSAGSDPIRFSDTLMFVNLDNVTQDFTYAATISWTNGTTNTDNSTLSQSISCSSLNKGRSNESSFCYLANESEGKGLNAASIYENWTCNWNVFGLDYQIQGNSFKAGYLNKGDVVKICFKSPRSVSENEKLKVSIIPMIGSSMIVETATPALMVDRRIPIYP